MELMDGNSRKRVEVHDAATKISSVWRGRLERKATSLHNPVRVIDECVVSEDNTITEDGPVARAMLTEMQQITEQLSSLNDRMENLERLDGCGKVQELHSIWGEYWSEKRGRGYWFNTDTGLSLWEKPSYIH